MPAGGAAKNAGSSGAANTSSSKTTAPAAQTSAVDASNLSVSAPSGEPSAQTTPVPISTANAATLDSMTPAQLSAVLTYFKSRGFKKGEDTLRAEIEALASGATPAQVQSTVEQRFGSSSVSLYDLAVKSAPREPNSSSTNNGSLNSGLASASSGGSASGNTMGPIERAAVDALLYDMTDRSRGFARLRNWCVGSLEIYQAELQPLLIPLFVHTYLDLIESGRPFVAAAFYTANSWNFLPQQAGLLADLRALNLPSHVASDPLAQRFRSERYVLKMSSTVFSLLLGWLTDGGGPAGGAGAGDGVGDDGKGDQDARAREAMLRIINDRCRVQIIDVKPQQLTADMLEEGTGLTGAGPSFSTTGSRSRKYPILQAAVVSERDAVADFNAAAAGPQLKLGANVPLSEKLQAEVEKEMRHIDRQDGNESDAIQSAQAPNQQGMVQPVYGDLPPQAPVYRVVDIEREVARIRDARKALHFNLSLNATTNDQSATALSGPAYTSGVRDPSFNALGEEGARMARNAAMPSVCSYTYHDADDGLTCSKFSPDLTLMAAGFEESYVQVWSLKGQPLRGMRNDFNVSSIRDRKALDRHRENTTQSTRKLIGHSAPVYSIDFDPSRGSSLPPRLLLSASGDATCRLWSLDTFTALVSYRGHQQPIWSVEWSPLGVYFATASADHTARLWSTERINPLRMYAGHLSDVDCLNFHPNSLYLATGSSDKTSRLWDVQRGACVRLFVGQQSPVSCVKISPDGRYLASAGAGNAPSLNHVGDDCSISIWDLASGRRIKKMWGHSRPVLAMDFSVDGSLLVSSAADCQVRCWDIREAGGARKGGDASKTISSGGAADATAGAQSANALSSSVNGGNDDGMIPLKTPRTANGIALNLQQQQQSSSADCISTFYTKQTPMLDVHFTPRNLCLSAGAFDASM